MEILNNMLNSLFVENETLINFLLLPISCIESFLSINLITSLLDIPLTKKHKLLYVIIFTLLGTINTTFIPAPVNTIVNFICAFIVFYFVFKFNLVQTIAGMISPILIFALIGNLILKPYLTLLNITYDQVTLIPIYRILYLMIIYIIVFLIILLIKLKKVKINILDDLDKHTKMIIIFNFVLGLFTLCISLYIGAFYIDVLPVSITFMSFISLFAYFFISLYSLTRITKLVTTKKELHNAEVFNRSLSILYDNIRGFKHDFDNIVATIGGYVQTDDIEGLKQYYSELEEDCQRTNNIATLNPNIINNPGIYNLLSSKYHKADEHNIKINLDFFLDLNQLNIKTYEFSRILGILLDNAIEASSECDEKIINIKFRNEEKNRRHIVVIENTYNNKDVDLNNIFNKGISGKEHHSGLGLWEIKKYVNRNKNLNLFTNKNDKFFTQQLEIYY